MVKELKKKIKKLLRRSEKYTGTDMVYLAKGGFWMTSRQIVVSVAGFLLSIAFANLLPKETFGTYKYILSIANILAISTLSGINDAVIRSVSRGYDKSLMSAVKTRLKWSILGSLASLGTAGYYFLNNNTELTIGFIIVAFFIPLKGPLSTYQAYWKGKERFDVFAKLVSLNKILSVGTLVAVLFLTDSLFAILVAYFAVSTVFSIILLYLTKRKIKEEAKDDPEAASYGKHLSILGILGRITNHLDNIIIWHFLGATPVAVYTFAKKVPEELRRVITQSFPIAFPRFSKRKKEKIKKTLLKKIGKLYILLIPLTLVYIIIAPWVYQTFFPQYLEAITYSRIFALTILFAPLSLLGIVFKAQARKRELYISGILSMVLVPGTLLIMVPLYGILGAVLAPVIYLSIGGIFQIYLFKKM